MKTVARIASLLLALVMVFGLSVTAFAAGPGTITVDNPLEGQTYTAYKIFDVTYDESKSTYAYSIAGDSEWYAVVSPYDGITLTKAASENTYAVTKNDSFSAAAFANVLKAAVEGKTGITLKLADGKATATGLDLGYYFVTSSTGALCNLTTTNPNATIHDKNDVPFDKVDDKTSVEVGETVSYTITGKVPDYTGFTTYTYLITDTMSEGLTFQKDATVTVGGTDVTSACTITYDVDSNANKFTVSIPVMNYTIGAEIKVTYTAVTNDKAVTVISKNSATLTYSNNPTDSKSKTTTPKDEETVYSAELVIDKYQKDNKSKKLANAKFVLKNDEGNYYKYTAATESAAAQVEWVKNQADATEVTTNTNGAAVFNGLKDGTYHLVETAAPAGYNLLANEVKVVINGAKATEVDLSSLTATAKVENSTGTTIPETGGIGTTIFYVAGGLLVLGAVILLITKKRMSSAK